MHYLFKYSTHMYTYILPLISQQGPQGDTGNPGAPGPRGPAVRNCHPQCVCSQQ